MFRPLVWIVDTSPAGDLATARAGIHPLRIAPLALLEGGVDEDLDEALRANCLANFVARRQVRTDRGAHRDPAMSDDLAGDEADAANVGVAILLAEAQPV